MQKLRNSWVGRVFGRLTVVEFHSRTASNRKWLCRCECGKLHPVWDVSLKNGDNRSCGCLLRESAAKLAKSRATHGKSKTKTYSAWFALRRMAGTSMCDRWKSFDGFLADMGDRPGIGYRLKRVDTSMGFYKENCFWQLRRSGMNQNPERKSWESMRSRCLNKSNPSYARYGGSGITVCDRWADSFSNFLEDMGSRPPGTTLDRINNSLGYSKENCRWATSQEQSRNYKKKNRWVDVNGTPMVIQDATKAMSITAATLRKRLKSGLVKTSENPLMAKPSVEKPSA